MADFVGLLTAALPEVAAADETLIPSTVARAARFAPCLLVSEMSDTLVDAAAGVLTDVLRRRAERVKAKVMAGMSTSEQEGGRSIALDARGVSDALFQPSEIAELQAICTEVGGAVLPVLPVGTFPAARSWPC